MTESDLPVFTPLQIGNIVVQHRIAMAPLTRCRADDDHVPHAVAAEYYSQRAGYPGTLLISEATFVGPPAGGQANVPGIYNDEQIEGWRSIVEAVHAKGSFIFLQLWFLGRAASAEQLRREGDYDVVSASDIALAGGDQPRSLSVSEIRDCAQMYAQAANAFVKRAGGDGVEIHAANGYLLDQFLQTNSNQRTDKYGGAAANRIRFTLEVTEAVAAAVGQASVGIRLSPFSQFQGMRMSAADREDTFSLLLIELKERFPSLAYLHLVEPRASGSTDVDVQQGDSLRSLADLWAPKVLLVAGGHGPGSAARVCQEYENSVAVYGRYFISNPDLVARIKHGVEFEHYDRDSFYLRGPSQTRGYTDYPILYGPDGKLK